MVMDEMREIIENKNRARDEMREIIEDKTKQQYVIGWQLIHIT